MPDSALETKIKPRRRGRPRADEAGGAALRESVIAATTAVYAEQGYNRTTVELILKAANISRPTFYKLFNDRREVINIIVERANNELRSKVAQSIIGIQSVGDMIRAGVEAYFEWCEAIGPLVGPIYSEINDAASPASEHRANIIADFVNLFHSQAELLDRPQLDPLMYDSLLRAVEHAGSSAFWPRRLSDVEIARRKTVALRIMLASLATEDMLAEVPALDSVLL